MRFLIFSDSHGRRDDMTEILSRQKSLDGVFHLGDGRQDLIGLLPLSGEIPLFAAVGNCDREPDREMEIMGLIERHVRQFFRVYRGENGSPDPC